MGGTPKGQITGCAGQVMKLSGIEDLQAGTL